MTCVAEAGWALVFTCAYMRNRDVAMNLTSLSALNSHMSRLSLENISFPLPLSLKFRGFRAVILNLWVTAHLENLSPKRLHCDS